MPKLSLKYFYPLLTLSLFLVGASFALLYMQTSLFDIENSVQDVPLSPVHDEPFHDAVEVVESRTVDC